MTDLSLNFVILVGDVSLANADEASFLVVTGHRAEAITHRVVAAPSIRAKVAAECKPGHRVRLKGHLTKGASGYPTVRATEAAFFSRPIDRHNLAP